MKTGTRDFLLVHHLKTTQKVNNCRHAAMPVQFWTLCNFFHLIPVHCKKPNLMARDFLPFFPRVFENWPVNKPIFAIKSIRGSPIKSGLGTRDVAGARGCRLSYKHVLKDSFRSWGQKYREMKFGRLYLPIQQNDLSVSRLKIPKCHQSIREIGSRRKIYGLWGQRRPIYFPHVIKLFYIFLGKLRRRWL